ncbi:hypothetical protein AB0D04_21635 [Streptomyces sp. NPDC048483]|uniref:hypothetical protein n=1 Tax=Streptomyces sp. NPDC048483 TaxID=3154927 RepID=UPI00341D6193
MKIAKAAAGVAGVALALGAASPALAAPEPRGGEKPLLQDSNLVGKSDLKNPIGDLDVKAFLGSVDKVADKLKTNNDTNAKTKVGDIAKAVR